jgi:hypothetical protein
MEEVYTYRKEEKGVVSSSESQQNNYAMRYQDI